MKTVASVDELLICMLEDLGSCGRESAPRGMNTFTMPGMSYELLNPRDRHCTFPARNIRKGYSAASVAWNLLQRHDVESISKYNPNGRKISDDGETFQGANYGERILKKVHGHRSPLYEAIELLRHDSDTRRAWVPLLNWYYDGGTYSKEGKDVPCTIGFQLENRDGALDMHVIMRSQAIIGVMPYDVFLFTVLQELIANELGLSLGSYIHHCIDAHVYEREYAMMDNILDEMDSLNDTRHDKVMSAISLNIDEATYYWGQTFLDLDRGVDIVLSSLDDEITAMMVCSDII